MQTLYKGMKKAGRANLPPKCKQNNNTQTRHISTAQNSPTFKKKDFLKKAMGAVTEK